MTDYRNDNNGYSEDPRARRLDDIYADVDASYHYGPEEERQYAQRRPDASRRRASAAPASSSRRSTGTGTRSGRTQSSQQSRTTRTAASGRSGSSAAYRESSSSRQKRNLIRKKKKKFKKLYLTYIAVLVVLLIIGSILFSSYLASFENGQPSHIAETISNRYSDQQGIIDFINANADKTDITDNVSLVAQTYATNIAGKKISFRENNDFRPDSPSYDITADGAIVAKVTLASDGTGSFGSPKWKISDLKIGEYLPDALSVTIEAPAGSTVKVNGSVLDNSKIVSTGVPEILSNALQFVAEPPQYDTYKMSGLLSDPTVEVTDASGTPLNVTRNNDRFFASTPADQAFIDSVEQRVYDAIDNYATYFIHMSFDLSNYIVYGSDLYSYIFGSDTMDPIATALYMFEDIDHYDFAERSASNYVKYADDCFTVDIKYALDMYFTDPTFEDNNQNMDATWVFVIEPLDGSWCIGDIITH